MIGYHYTSYENWKSIKRQGLIPYDLGQTCAGQYHKAPGIFTWPKRQRGKSHWGQILWTFVRRETSRVVLLAFEFDPREAWPWSSDDADNAYHTGSMSTPYNKFVFHSREPYVIVSRRIDPADIKLVGVYGVKRLQRVRSVCGTSR